MNYVAYGSDRLEYLLETDPAAQQRLGGPLLKVMKMIGRFEKVVARDVNLHPN